MFTLCDMDTYLYCHTKNLLTKVKLEQALSNNTVEERDHN
jgi:hypothetical protein